MKRASLVVLGASLVLVLIWFVPLHAAANPSNGHTPPTSQLSDVAASRSAKPASLAQVEELVGASVKVQRLDKHTYAQLSTIFYDNADIIESIPVDCTSATTGCVFGDTASHRVAVLFGDSHARMWLPAIIPIATADHLKLIVIGKDGCPVVAPSVPGRFGDCASVITHAIAVIDRLRPAAVIMADRTTYRNVSSTTWREGLSTTIGDLRQSGASVAVIGDIQVFNAGTVSDLLECLVDHAKAVQRCAVRNPNRAAPGHEAAEQAAASSAHDTYVNPNPWLCTHLACSPVIGNNIVYWDSFHITVNYATYLSGVMGAALGKFLHAASLRGGS